MGGRNMDRWTIARRALEAQSQLNQRNRRSSGPKLEVPTSSNNTSGETLAISAPV
jgi:hypothetical protein